MAGEKLTSCPTCQAQIAKNAKTCPSCGAKMKKPIFKKWWFWLIIVVVLISIGGGAGGNTNDEPKVPVDGATTEETATDTTADEEVAEPEPEPVEDFEIVGDLTTEDDGFAFYISGALQNNTDKTYGYAQITFNLYDASGAQIGTALANVNNLEANGTWKFKAMGMGENGDVATYKFMGVDAF